MTIKYLRSALRKSLSLLILSLFLFPAISTSQDSDEGLELPEIYIYGTHLGKIQLSPKKDFFQYLQIGNLYPHSRPLSPELRYPVYRKIPREIAPVQQYWLLVDARAGNWWSDKIFLDCGLRNQHGLLSLRFTDFRRKNWAEDHSIIDDYVRLKGALWQENYYISGSGFYEYNDRIKKEYLQSDTFATRIWGVNVLTKSEIQPNVIISGQYSMGIFLDRYFGMSVVIPRTVSEHVYSYSVSYRNPFDFFDIKAHLRGEGASKTAEGTGDNSTSTNMMVDLILQKDFDGKFVLAPGVRVFIAEDAIKAAPLVSLQTVIPGLNLYPYVVYMKEQQINTLTSLYRRYPLVNNINYSIGEEEEIEVGVEGRWQQVLYRGSYSRIKYEDLPLRYDQNQGYVPTLSCERDMITAGIDAVVEGFVLKFKGSYSPREKILYEPVSKFDGEVYYTGIPRIVPFAGVNSEFSIETQTDTVDVFRVNSGVEYQVLKNFALRFEAENIFDQRYEIWPGFTEGGIQFYASLKYKIIK